MAHDVNALLYELQSLRAELQFYKQHHQVCIVRRQPSPPPDDECCNGLKIVPFKPEPGRKQTDSRYTDTVTQLLRSVPDALAWIPVKDSLGLRNNSIICHIFGIYHISQVDIEPAAHSLSIPTTDPTDLIALATQFALLTKRSACRANVSSMVRTYQECVLVSLCVVLQHHGIDLEHINNVMRICVSDSGDNNLYVIRLAAIWLNKTIVGLQASKRWGRRAGEAFFLSRLSMSKYTRLMKQKSSLQYIVDKLSDQKYFSEQLDMLNDIPLSIPAFIKIIVKEKLTLQQICSPLGYDSPEEIGEICLQYTAILNAALLPERNTRSENKKRKLIDYQSTQLDWDPIRFVEDLEWEKIYCNDAEEGAKNSAEENDGELYMGPYMGAVEGAEDD